MSSTLGTIYKISSWGESHGKGIGVVIDGCPAGITIDHDLIHRDLQRRKPGQSAIVTQRKEEDGYEILSGTFKGKTTGTPIAIWIANTDQRSRDYSHIADKYRPSHADYTYAAKYGVRDYRGGGRSSARETAARVAAGAIAKMLLRHIDVRITTYVSAVGVIDLSTATDIDYRTIEDNAVRCPSPTTAATMITHIKDIKKQGDTIGGIVNCTISNCPVGLGEPVFDKLHADLAKAMMSINAVKGFEYGSGFAAARMRGSAHNDPFVSEGGTITTTSNHSGGIQGGISNGMDINMRVAFKPVATIIKPQESIDESGAATTVVGKGRHDPCVVPRAVPIVEAMAAITIADHWLRHRAASPL